MSAAERIGWIALIAAFGTYGAVRIIFDILDIIR